MRPAIAALVVLLVAGQAGGAPYLHPRADAQQSGAAEGPGPEWLDVAFALQTHLGEIASDPLIVGDEVYLLTLAFESSPSTAMHGVWRINLASGAVEAFLEFPILAEIVDGGLPGSTASDRAAQVLLRNDNFWYVVFADGVDVFDLAGEPAWQVAWQGSPTAQQTCAHAAFHGPLLVVGCGGVAAAGLQVHGIQDGAWQWTWERPVGGYTGPTEGVAVSTYVFIVGVYVSQDGSSVFSLTNTRELNGFSVVELRRHDVATGQELNQWNAAFPALNLLEPDPYQQFREFRKVVPLISVNGLLGPDAFYVASAGRLYVIDFDLATNWSLDYEPADSITVPGLAMALADTKLLGDIRDTAFLIDVRERGFAWDEPRVGRGAAIGQPIMVGGVGYFATDARSVDAVSIDSGAIVDSATLAPSPTGGSGTPRLAAGDGWLLVADNDGLTAFGRSALSIQLEASLNNEYPPVDGPVVVDVAATKPGALAPDLEFRVEWGDGQTSPWTNATQFSHFYNEKGPETLVVHARNSMYQTARLPIAVDVGGAPVRAPTFLEVRFAPENQETTFFVLGLAITFLAAAIAAARVARKRSRLRREIHRVDELANRQSGNPLALHRAMAERQEHAKTLLVAGRLDEAQYAVLKGHIDAVAAGGRLESIEQDFPFLPVSLAGTLQRMLDDGRITKWERQTFRAALESDDVLTKTQKTKVAGRIDAWFAEDS